MESTASEESSGLQAPLFASEHSKALCLFRDSHLAPLNLPPSCASTQPCDQASESVRTAQTGLSLPRLLFHVTFLMPLERRSHIRVPHILWLGEGLVGEEEAAARAKCPEELTFSFPRPFLDRVRLPGQVT